MSDDAKRRKLGSKRQLPSGRWQIRVASGSKYDGTRRVVSETLDTEEEADARILSLAAELGRRPDLSNGITLSALWAEYRVDRGERLARSTMDRYEKCMARAWLPRLGDRDISLITRADAQSVLMGAPSANEARQMKAALSSALTWAVRMGWLSENPIRQGGFETPTEKFGGMDASALDEDPFGTIEGSRDVWDARTVLEVFRRLQGAPIEPVWLAMVGGGLRLEEAFGLRRADIRRIAIDGSREVTQVAVHHTRNQWDGRHATKTSKSVRIAAVVDPFGLRLWDISNGKSPKDLLCDVSLQNYGARWRCLFEEPRRVGSRTDVNKGRLLGIRYLPLSRMRATHATIAQEAGILDSMNAGWHGNTEKVLYSNYQSPDLTDAAIAVEDYLRLVV